MVNVNLINNKNVTKVIDIIEHIITHETIIYKIISDKLFILIAPL